MGNYSSIDYNQLFMPVLDERKGQQLLNSKVNPDRYRGLSIANDKSRDIPEFIKVDPNALINQNNLSPGKEFLAEMIGNMAGQAVGTVVSIGTRWAWLKAKTAVMSFVQTPKTISTTEYVELESRHQPVDDDMLMLDNWFENNSYEMSTREFQGHMRAMVEDFIDINARMTLINNSLVELDGETDEQYLERKKVSTEAILSRSAKCLNNYLELKQMRTDYYGKCYLEDVFNGGYNSTEGYLPIPEHSFVTVVQERAMELKHQNNE